MYYFAKGEAMIEARYDRYDGTLPLFMNSDIERTATIRSHEQNWHEELEIQFFEEGSGYVLIDGERIEVECGDAVVIAPNVIHYTGTEGRLLYSCAIISSDFLMRAGIDTAVYRPERRIRCRRAGELFKGLKEEYISGSEPLRMARLQKLLLELLLSLPASFEESAKVGSAEKRAQDNVRSAIKYIRESYASRITLDKLAAAACCDKYTLCRDFKRMTGQTLIEYTNSYRVRLASELISEGSTVAEAAERCGFENLSFFTRCFKRYTGALPSSFKKLLTS